MKPRNVLIASAVAVTLLATGCSSGGSGGGAPRFKPEKTNIVVNAFPAIDSAGLYIAQDEGLFAAQGLHVTIVPVKTPPPSTQDLVNGQMHGQYDITAGDYVTYIQDQLGIGAPKADLRIIAESSFLQPNVLTVLVKGGSGISRVSQLKGRLGAAPARGELHEAVRPTAEDHQVPGHQHDRWLTLPPRSPGPFVAARFKGVDVPARSLIRYAASLFATVRRPAGARAGLWSLWHRSKRNLTTWMPHPCCWNDVDVASTPYHPEAVRLTSHGSLPEARQHQRPAPGRHTAANHLNGVA